MSGDIKPDNESSDVLWAAFQGSCNPNTGSDENKDKLINSFLTLLSSQEYARKLAKPAFKTQYTPEDVKLVLLTTLTNSTIEWKNGKHCHIYFVWCWEKKPGRCRFFVDLQSLRLRLTDMTDHDTVKKANIDIKFVEVNPNLYSVNLSLRRQEILIGLNENEILIPPPQNVASDENSDKKRKRRSSYKELE